MTKNISFTVYGEPSSLKRHRAYRRGQAMIMVDPSKEDKQDFLTQAIKNRPSKPLSDALKLEVKAFFKRPKSHYNKKGLKTNAPIHCTKIPDADNLLKFVGDALNAVFWDDDKQITHAVITKAYSETPRVEVNIEVLL